VAQTLSFRRAAAETFSSQSALSAHVMRLEELGIGRDLVVEVLTIVESTRKEVLAR